MAEEPQINDNEVPISVDDLIELRTTFANVGIYFIRKLQQAEAEVNGKMMEVCLTHGVSPEEFQGIDIERGVIRKKIKPLIVPGGLTKAN